VVTIADFDQERYAATDQVRCISIYVPDDDSYLPLLAGLLSLPGYQTNYQDPESAQAEGVAAVWRDAYILTDWSRCVPPSTTSNQSRVSLWHRWANIVSGNAFQIVVDTNLLFNHYARQNTAAVGDETSQDVWLSAGDYAMRVLYYRLANNGKISFIFQHQETLDQVTPISLVDISGTTLANQVLSATFTLTETGMYKMFTHIGAVGAAGAGAFAALIMTEVWKTADP
jgi:hypothetical protein